VFESSVIKSGSKREVTAGRRGNVHNDEREA